MAEGIETIAVDLPCLGCGYNLRMLPVEGRCPECGGRVQWSLEDTVLRWGPDHLRRMGRCAVRAAVTALAMPVLLMGGVLVMDLIISRVWRSPVNGEDFETYYFYRSILEALVWLPVEAAVIWHVVAVWRGTRRPARERLGTPVIFMRIGMFLFAAATLAPAVLMLLSTFSIRPRGEGIFKDQELISLEHAVLYLLPLLLVGAALYPWQAAVWVGGVYRRAGLSAKKGFMQWSLRVLATFVVLLAGILGGVMILENSTSGIPRGVEIYVRVLALAGIGVLIASGIGAVIALFIFGRRMRQLAAMSPASEEGFILMTPAPAKVSGADERDGNPRGL